ncbi:hypothetical protein GEOBRER4_n3366 [Citrifermentans bremense]|uniref:Uncharacterized protein n=1 Tax=Citrifermentans bremense TaxID=60035 RepID=A0A7R7FSJ2_9BACT|nr:hypothetical protein GEOBRER4_n3366 [Citrifermentans bremense]
MYHSCHADGTQKGAPRPIAGAGPGGDETAKGGTLADSPFVKLKQPVPAAD